MPAYNFSYKFGKSPESMLMVNARNKREAIGLISDDVAFKIYNNPDLLKRNKTVTIGGSTKEKGVPIYKEPRKFNLLNLLKKSDFVEIKEMMASDITEAWKIEESGKKQNLALAKRQRNKDGTFKLTFVDTEAFDAIS